MGKQDDRTDEMQSTEEGQEETTGGRQRVRVSDEEKRIADKKEVICPLTLKVTGGKLAVNYDITWLSETQLPGEEEVGCWRSQPQQRGHADAFYAELDRMRKEGLIEEDQKAFYFTHDAGIKAREKYQELVLSGKVKANKKSWTNRFEEFTGATFAQLQEEFPQLYSQTAAHSDKEKKLIQEEKPKAVEMDLDDLDPSDEDIETTMESDDDSEGEPETTEEPQEEEEPVAAATMTEEAATEEVPDDDENDDDETTIISLSELGDPEEVTSDCIMVKGTGGLTRMFYLVELPHDEEEYFLEAGTIEIEGNMYDIRVPEDNDSE